MGCGASSSAQPLDADATITMGVMPNQSDDKAQGQAHGQPADGAASAPLLSPVSAGLAGESPTLAALGSGAHTALSSVTTPSHAAGVGGSGGGGGGAAGVAAHPHSAASSTTFASDTGAHKAGGATPHAPNNRRHSHSGSKLDVLNESGGFATDSDGSSSSSSDNAADSAGASTRDLSAERAAIMAKVLVCANCEEATTPLAVWCADCARPSPTPHPPVYCGACNDDLHQFAKTRGHVREPLSIRTTRMKSAAELGMAGSLLPLDLPALESLACSNCDGDVNVYCSACKTLLCTNCARDIHNPKLLRAHLRTPVALKFIVAGFKASASTRAPAPKERADLASTSLLRRDSNKVSVVSASGVTVKTSNLGGTRPSALQLISRTPTAAASAAASTATTPLAAAAAATAAATAASANTRHSSTASATFMPSDSPPSMTRKHTKVRPKTTETSDIVPVENPGVPGDVFAFADPSIDGPLNESQLELRNISNPYDMIGTVQIVSLSCGTDHAGFVTAMGSLFMVGSNVEGQLGCGSRLGTERWSATPLLIEFERHNPVRQVACGAVHTLALCQDSRVYSFGQGAMGKLGQARLCDGVWVATDADQDTPAPVQLGHWGPRGDAETEDQSGSEEVVFIACGQNNSGCVVRGRKDKYQLYLFGEGASGQIPAPDGDENAELVPRLFPSLVRLTAPEGQADRHPELSCLSFGTKHVAVATTAGAVYTFGDNSFGQCGYSTSGDGDNRSLQLRPRLVPKLFLEGVRARSVVCGERHTTVLASNGDVWSFGSGESHQLGVMDNADCFQPQRAVGLGPASNNPIVHVSVGAAISAAVNEAGETFMWGYGVETAVPRLVEGLRGRFGQACGVGSNANVVFLTGSNKELYEWQFDGSALGEEGGGIAEGEVAAGLISHDEPLSASDSDEGGGEGGGGGLGAPQINLALRGKKLRAMSAGKNHFAVVTGDGKMFAYGSNHLFECGLKLPGDVSFVPHPLEVRFPSGPDTVIVDVRCSVEHSMALDSLGRVHTWGTGFSGRLGHTSNGDVPQPRVVQSLVDAKVVVRSMAIGPSNCGAVCADGGVWMWGAGNGGQIGNEELMPAFKPVRVRALAAERVVALAIGNYHAMCLTDVGDVYTWGDNRFGQLGLSSFHEEQAAYPQSVRDLNALGLRPTAVECGDNVCMALTAAGEVWGWGTGETMQLCRQHQPAADQPSDELLGAGEDVHSPVRLCFPFQKKGNKRRIVSLSVRDINCCCLTEDGDVYSWGWDLGEYPTKLVVRKPASGSAAGAGTAAASSPSSAAAASSSKRPVEEVKWDRIALGHTRMMLTSC